MEKAVDQNLVLKPIGFFKSEAKNPYDLPRQPDDGKNLACIELLPQQNFEQALEGLEEFDRVWVIYHFHHNDHWKPKTLPPRGSDKKLGVFSTRSPYRPNPIGLSCLKILKIEGRKIWVEGADLMDETPIFDLKPYVSIHDSFPEASLGWLQSVEEKKWIVTLNPKAQEQLNWLASEEESKIQDFILRQLEYDPLNSDKKRVSQEKGHCTLAYRTWRVDFFPSVQTQSVEVLSIRSAYHNDELNESALDPYKDKELHRKFIMVFNETRSNQEQS